MIQVVEALATNTNGESKQEIKFKSMKSIASASRRGEALAVSAKDLEPRAPVGAAHRTGLSLSMIIPMKPLVAAVIHG